MLVCWDGTYAQRLWCVLEMEDDKALIIRPVSWGPTVLLLFLGHWVFIVTYQVGVTFFASLQLDMAHLWLAMSGLMALPHVIILPVVLHAWRSQMRGIETVQEQLRRFDFYRDTACHCCAVKHIHPQSGKMMLCDRKILAESVATWFGSVSDFETVVQEKVSVVFQEKFQKYPLPYVWMAAAAIPNIWMAFPDFGHMIAAGQYTTAAAHAYGALSWWLAGYQAILLLELRLAHRLRRQRSRWWCDMLLNICIGLVCALVFVVVMMTELLFMLALGENSGQVLYYSLLIVLAVAVWRR
ncbi:unnamed protein product [Symbiodinium pilosum]|uniref:Uncharacterized protein n=1 Tax=Symbiodinium pilosum TaxID=2952 RepID=A0A812W810_SYMPI|nr:unnamed protein product [Symbiodinium pilosum]